MAFPGRSSYGFRLMASTTTLRVAGNVMLLTVLLLFSANAYPNRFTVLDCVVPLLLSRCAMVATMVSPAKLCGCAQSLTLCVKDWLVPSEKCTVKVCEAWLPLTPAASTLSEPNWPEGRVTVALATALAAITGPNAICVLLNVTEEPSRFEE